MKHTLTVILCLFFSVCSYSSLSAQSTLKKANKEYELFAFNLAIKSYLKVLEKEPNNAQALARLADSYRHINQINEAVKYYERAIQQPGLDPVHIFNYGQALQNLGKYEEARKVFLNYAEGQPMFGNHFAENTDFAIKMRGIPPLYRVKNEYANTVDSDFAPAFFKDNIIFASSRRDIGAREIDKGSADWAGGARNQLFITERDQKGFLKRPAYLQNDLKNNYNMAPVSYTADGKRVAITKNNFVEGTRQLPSSGMEMSIYLADVDPDGTWRDAKPFPYNGSGYSSGYAAFAPDGNTIYFSSNRPDGFGGFDIYATYKTNNTWSTPVNLGPNVNSPGNELTPFTDGSTLYFSSDWHQGLGGLDIFRAEQEKGQWTKVYHLGNGVNSSRDDFGFIYDNSKNIGYFVSNRIGGKGREDIYQLTKMTDNIELRVLDAKDKLPIAGAMVDFSSCEEGIFQTGSDGKYVFQALGGMDCEVVVSKKGYSSYAFKLTSKGKQENQQMDIILAKDADRYIGRIFHSEDNSAVSDVRVIVTDQNTNQQMETRSDENGVYYLALNPKTTYLIRYTKAKFLDTHNRIETGDGKNKGVLGVLAFKPALSSIVVAGTPAPTGGSTAPEKEEIPQEADKILPGTGKLLADAGEAVVEGYSVQVAAVYGDKLVQPANYTGLRGIGNLYSRPENGYKKVRVGIYQDKSEAIAAQREISRKGFASSFIVRESLEDMVDVEFLYKPDAQPQQPAGEAVTTAPAPAAKPTAPEKVKETPPAAPQPSLYKVRLASYKNPAYFKPQLVDDYGTIEKMKSGSYTIMLLSGYQTLNEAIKAQRQAVKSGFKGAHVVIEDDGRLVKVNI